MRVVEIDYWNDWENAYWRGWEDDWQASCHDTSLLLYGGPIKIICNRPDGKEHFAFHNLEREKLDCVTIRNYLKSSYHKTKDLDRFSIMWEHDVFDANVGFWDNERLRYIWANKLAVWSHGFVRARFAVWRRKGKMFLRDISRDSNNEFIVLNFKYRRKRRKLKCRH